MIALYIISSIILILFIYILISSIIYKRSLFSSLVELYLYVTSKYKWHKRLPKTFISFIKKHHIKENKEIILKDKHLNIKKINYKNMKTFIITPSQNAKNVVIYLHGGAYISNPTYFHNRYVKKLAKKSNSIVVYPIYPKTPQNNFQKTFSVVKSLYEDILKHNKYKTYMIGDSSGGGLSLAILQDSTVLPTYTYLFSPWLDISLTSKNIEKYEKVDPMLSIIPIRYIGEYYAKGTNLKDFKVSPLYGKVSSLYNISIIYGDREILYPEIEEFKKNCLKENINLDFVLKKGMNHCFPLYPIKEAKVFFNEIVDKIKS